MRPYVLYRKPYTWHCGGHKSIHWLCHYLNNGGAEAYVTHEKRNPLLKTPYLSPEHRGSLIKDGAIVIYPERVDGNPWGARSIVRWQMCAPAFTAMAPLEGGEVLITSNRLMAPEGALVVGVPWIETEVFRPDSSFERTERVCAFAGRCDHPMLQETSDALWITPETVPTRIILSRVFKTFDVFYCYDELSSLIIEATMCGCPTVVVPSGHWTREEWARCRAGWDTMDGVAWGPEELDRARETVGRRYGQYFEYEFKFVTETIPTFIEMTQEAFS